MATKIELQKPFEEFPLSEKIEKVEEVVKKEILPMLAMDGGSLDVMDIREGANRDTYIYVKYRGACAACAMAGGATLFAIEETLRKRLGSDRIRVVIL
ncbi:MAG: NifU family protein [Campylobacterales bacterium]